MRNIGESAELSVEALPASAAALDGQSADAWKTDPLPRRKLIFAICAMALFMASIDSTIVATALHRIGPSLHARINWLGWTITIYSLGQIVTLPVAGRISDQFGRKRLFLFCTALFTAASVACGLATSIYVLVPLRLLQSIGGGGFLPSASGIVADHFGRERDRALGLFSSIFPLGGVAGPIFGGIITEFWSWRGIFFVNLPIGLALLALIAHYVPESESKRGDRVDFLGIGLLAGTLVTAMLAITTMGEAGARPQDPTVFVPALVAIVFGFFFVRHAGRARSPIIPLRLIRGKGFASMNVLNVILGGAGFGFGVLIPLYAVNRYHLGTAAAGTVLSAQAIGMITCATLASYLLHRTGYRKPMMIGFALVAISLVLLSIGARHLTPYWWIALSAMLSGFGLGTVAPAANNATLSLAPDQVAAISGLRATFRQTGSILCISTVTAILARSADPGIAQSHVFWVLAVLICCAIALSTIVPDHKGPW